MAVGEVADSVPSTVPRGTPCRVTRACIRPDEFERGNESGLDSSTRLTGMPSKGPSPRTAIRRSSSRGSAAHRGNAECSIEHQPSPSSPSAGQRMTPSRNHHHRTHSVTSNRHIVLAQRQQRMSASAPTMREAVGRQSAPRPNPISTVRFELGSRAPRG